MTADDSSVAHDPVRHRFAIAIGGDVAALDYRRVDEHTVDYYHTFVPRSFRGRGVASRLAEHALQYAIDNDLTVVPTCPFIKAYVARNPRFRTVVR